MPITRKKRNQRLGEMNISAVIIYSEKGSGTQVSKVRHRVEVNGVRRPEARKRTVNFWYRFFTDN